MIQRYYYALRHLLLSPHSISFCNQPKALLSTVEISLSWDFLQISHLDFDVSVNLVLGFSV